MAEFRYHDRVFFVEIFEEKELLLGRKRVM